jgi:hypothetical protein
LQAKNPKKERVYKNKTPKIHKTPKKEIHRVFQFVKTKKTLEAFVNIKSKEIKFVFKCND